MFIHFDLPSDSKMQHKRHQMFRYKIAEWKEVRLVSRAVLTHHYSIPPSHPILFMFVST